MRGTDQHLQMPVQCAAAAYPESLAGGAAVRVSPDGDFAGRSGTNLEAAWVYEEAWTCRGTEAGAVDGLSSGGRMSSAAG